METAQEAFTLFTTKNVKSTRLQVGCETNRLLAVYLWLLVEKESHDNPGILQNGRSRWSKALRGVVGEDRPILDVKTLKTVKNIGPKLSKEIVENLWSHYPPLQQDSLKRSEMEEEVDAASSKSSKKPRPAKKSKSEYRPMQGTANFAFLITLLEAFERRQESSLTKSELMQRAEESGLSKTPIFGRDPILQKKIAQRTNSPIRIFAYSGWNSIKTLVNRQVPLVEMSGRPRNVKLTEKGLQIAREIREEAIHDGLIPEELPPPDAVPQTCNLQTSRDLIPVQEEVKRLVQRTEALELPFLDPDSTFQDDFEVVLVIDQREQFCRIPATTGILNKTETLALHLDVLEQAGIPVSIRQLDIGDALWIARRKTPFQEKVEEFVLDWIVERKRVDDLSASIIDKRYEQQKYWLNASGLKNVVYIVEGDPSQVDRGKASTIGDLKAWVCVLATAVKTATLSTEVFENFRIFKTRNYTETLKLYVQITRYIEDLYRTQGLGIPTTSSAPSLDSFNAQLAAKRKLKTKDVWGLFLTKIPGIGPDSAASVVESFPTPFAFYSSVCTTQEEHIDRLSQLSISEGRKLGKVKATKIMNALFPEATLSK